MQFFVSLASFLFLTTDLLYVG